MSVVPPPRRPSVPVLRPTTLAEALRVRGEHPDYLVLAGGTDAMVLLHTGRLSPPGVLDLWGVDDLHELDLRSEGARLGALVTFAALLDQPDVAAGWPLLVEAAATVGAVQIRARATLGGNVVNASPAGDSLPALAVYEAELEIASAARGSRRVPLAAFYRGYKDLDLAPDELLVAVHLQRPAPGLVQRFRKVGTRRAQAISKLSMALTLARGADGRRLADVRLAAGALGPYVCRLPLTEALLEGSELTEALVEQVRQSVEREVSPIDDVRSTASYRRVVAGRVVARFLTELL